MKANMKEKESKLELWQSRFDKAKAAQSEERQRFTERELLYRGVRDETMLPDSGTAETPHIYNIIAELIESQVDSSIYPVKVTAVHSGDEAKALKIEHRINAIITSLATEELIDMAERTVPVQGGVYWHIEWDNSLQTHTSHGGISISERHPINVIPQDGATSTDEMDYLFLELGQTQDYIKRTFGVDVSGESEESPEARSAFGENAPADDFVTLRIAFYRNGSGGIGKVAWVGNTLLCDIEDFEARHLRRCAVCGAPEPPACDAANEKKKDILSSVYDRLTKKNRGRAVYADERTRGSAAYCTECGSGKWITSTEEYETLLHDIALEDGTVIPAVQADGTKTKIPYYKPRTMPIVLQKSISAPNQLLGISDVDLIEDQQKTMNRLEDDMIRRLGTFGGVLVLPPDVTIEPDGGYNVVRPGNIADASLIDLKDFQMNITQFLNMKAQIYEEAKNIIGITDSYLGRYDPSAKSGVAKQTSAAQAAGRLQSKRTMKAAAWARIYEIIFKYLLAYDDDTHDVKYFADDGSTAWETWNRYDFLKMDAAGEYYWDDEYLFSCDASLSVFSDRETLWQQILSDYSAGAYGNPQEMDAIIHLWRIREELHYPMAGRTRRYLEAKKKAADEAELKTLQMQQAAALMQQKSLMQPTQMGDGSFA